MISNEEKVLLQVKDKINAERAQSRFTNEASTEINEWYIKGLNKTKEIIEEVRKTL